MEKIAVGADGVGAIDLSKSPTENLHNIAQAKDRHVEDLTVVILDRPRHEELIAEVRKTGARIWLIGDGDVSAAIATCKEETGVDVLMGTGGAPEGVIAAAALRCVGGDFKGRLVYRNEADRKRTKNMGIDDLERIYGIHDLAKGPVMFSATGVTQGTYLDGVRFTGNGAITHSVVMRSESGTIRFIETEHHFDREPEY